MQRRAAADGDTTGVGDEEKAKAKQDYAESCAMDKSGESDRQVVSEALAKKGTEGSVFTDGAEAAYPQMEK